MKEFNRMERNGRKRKGMEWEKFPHIDICLVGIGIKKWLIGKFVFSRIKIMGR